MSMPGWVTIASPGRLTHAVENVDHAFRKTGSQSQFGQPHAGERRLLGELHHDCVAAGKGRAPLPGEHQQREVPGNDLPDDADRLPQRVGEEVAADGNGPPFDLVGPTGVITERIEHALHVAAGVGDRLAAIERFEDRQILGVLFDEVGQFEHQLAAVGGVHRLPRPRFEGLAGGLRGGIDVLALASATWQMVSPVAGLIVANVFWSLLSTNRPLINSGWSFTVGTLTLRGFSRVGVAMIASKECSAAAAASPSNS